MVHIFSSISITISISIPQHSALQAPKHFSLFICLAYHIHQSHLLPSRWQCLQQRWLILKFSLALTQASTVCTLAAAVLQREARVGMNVNSSNDIQKIYSFATFLRKTSNTLLLYAFNCSIFICSVGSISFMSSEISSNAGWNQVQKVEPHNRRFDHRQCLVLCYRRLSLEPRLDRFQSVASKQSITASHRHNPCWTKAKLRSVRVVRRR